MGGGRGRKRRVCDLSTHINWENAWIKPSTNDQYAVLRTRDRLVPPGHQMNSQQFLSSSDPIILLDVHKHLKTIECLSMTLDYLLLLQQRSHCDDNGSDSDADVYSDACNVEEYLPHRSCLNTLAMRCLSLSNTHASRKGSSFTLLLTFRPHLVTLTTEEV